MKLCLCLICYKPNDVWLELLSKFTRYDIFIIIDDNSKDYKDECSRYKNINIINIIQIKDEECKKNGFVNMNFVIKKMITSWEKAMYYFSTLNTEYDRVWFFEDDVFFYNEDSFLKIDSKYNTSDLLSNTYIENLSGDKNAWHWRKIDIQFAPPYYSGMMCCVRMSSRMLSKIRNYANEYNTLFFLEALFPTLCKKYDFQYDTPSELKNIIYRKVYLDRDIDKNNIYHPVKDISKHTHYRNMLHKKA
jgi:hypothetical protein